MGFVENQKKLPYHQISHYLYTQILSYHGCIQLTFSETATFWLRYLGLGVARAVGQSDSSGSVLVSGIGMRERGSRSWFQSSCGSVSTRQGRAKSVSRE